MQIYININFLQQKCYFLFSVYLQYEYFLSFLQKVYIKFCFRSRKELHNFVSSNTSTMDNTAIKIVNYFDDIEEFLIGILFFTLPFGWAASIIPLVLFATMLIINMVTKAQQPSRDKILYFAPLMGLILWELISLIYTSDLKNGLSTIGTQTVLFLLPLTLLFNQIKQKTILKALYLFLLGCTSSILLLFLLAFYKSSSIIGDAYIFRPFFDYASSIPLDTDVTGHYFLGQAFSSLIHPAYMALMLGIAMFLVLSQLRMDSTWLKNKQLWLGIFTLFGIGIISMSLNASFIIMIFIILIVLGVMSTQRLYYGELSRSIYFSVLVFILLLLLNPQVNQIISNPASSTSLQKRSIVSQAALESIQDKWLLGYGIGTEKEVLSTHISEQSNSTYNLKHPNAHNQFLSTWIQGGLPALALLLSSFWAMYKRARRKNSILVLAFGILIFISFLFESMLNRYWGALTFSLFYCIFFFYSNESKAGQKPSLSK